MNRFLAIAIHEIRFAFRSKLILSVAFLVLGIVIFLPMTLKDDGTEASRQQILISYTLGAVTWVLSTATLLWSSTAISRERKSGAAILVATKPVRMSVLWMGKWIGIGTAMFFTLLCASVLVVIQLHRTPTSNGTSGALHPQNLILPDETNFEAEIDTIMNRLSATHQIPDGVPEDAFRIQLYNQLRRQKSVIAPNQTARWTFQLPLNISSTGSASIETRFNDLAAENRTPLSGQWMLFDATGKRILHTMTMTNFYGGQLRIPVPANVFPDMTSSFSVHFVNGASNLSSTVAFPTKDPIRFLHSRGSFMGNLIICLVFWGGVIALISSVGLFCSACFESPTAAFCSTAIILMVIIASATAAISPLQTEHHHHGHEHEQENGRFSEASEHMNLSLAHALEPITAADLTQQFAGGINLSWKKHLMPGLIRGAIITSFFASIAIVIMNRQELENLERGGDR